VHSRVGISLGLDGHWVALSVGQAIEVQKSQFSATPTSCQICLCSSHGNRGWEGSGFQEVDGCSLRRRSKENQSIEENGGRERKELHVPKYTRRMPRFVAISREDAQGSLVSSAEAFYAIRRKSWYYPVYSEGPWETARSVHAGAGRCRSGRTDCPYGTAASRG
jgi:hypothetical protein